MKIAKFTYKKSSGDTSERAVIVLVEPSKFLAGIDVTSFVIDSSYKDALQSLIFTVVLGLGIACTLFFEKNFRDPVPEFTQVTATRIGSGDFSREETSGRYSTTLAGYLAYRINDGSNLTFFVRVYNGTVIADEILLYKVAKK